MDEGDGNLDDLGMREAFGLAKLDVIWNLSLRFIATLVSFGIHKIFAFFIFSLCGLLILFWIRFLFSWTCLLEGTCLSLGFCGFLALFTLSWPSNLLPLALV